MQTHAGVVSGDITRITSDALITAINSGGLWFGGIDGAIMRVAGGIFHNQATAVMPLTDGQTIIATDKGFEFANVIFVVDDLERKLREVVYAGLKTADNAGFGSVTLPTIRMGVVFGLKEKSVDETIAEMVEGVKQFLADDPKSVHSILFVVYKNILIETHLRDSLKQAGIALA